MSLRFLFIQFEFTHALGPHAGSYVVVVPGAEPPPPGLHPALEARNEEVAGVKRPIGSTDVLIVGVRQTGAATGRGRFLLNRPRNADPDAGPLPVPLALATYVAGTEPLPTAARAKQRLDELRFSRPAQGEWVMRGLETLNRAIRAYRIGAPDPYARDVEARDARVIRIGYGQSHQLQEGDYEAAIELAPDNGPKPKREERLRPAEAVANFLNGRDTLFEAEDILLRGLLDLDHGRSRGAAQQTAAAMRLLRGEVSGLADSRLDLDSLAARSRRAHELASVSDERSLSDAEGAELREIIDAVADLLAGWRAQRDLG